MQVLRKLSPLLIIALIIQLLSPLMLNHTAMTFAATNGPVVTSQFPASNTVNAPLRPNIIVWFDENVEISDSSKLIRVRNQGTNTTIHSIQINRNDISGNKLEVALPRDLDKNTNYQIVVEADAVKNVSNGKPLASEFKWNFKTTNDVTPPTILSVSYDACPMNVQTGNFDTANCVTTYPPEGGNTLAVVSPTNTSIKLQFSENVVLGTGHLELRNAANNDIRKIDVNSPQVQGAGSKTITITPNSPLLPEQTYTLTVMGGSTSNFKDEATLGLVSNQHFSFQTVSDTITLDSRTPSQLINVGLDASNRLSIGLTFNRTVVPVKGKYLKVFDVKSNTQVSLIDVRNLQNEAGGTSFTYTTQNALNPNTEYFITLDEYSFGLAHGRALYRGLTETTTWRFKTKAAEDKQPPVLTSDGLTPKNNATNVSRNANIVLKFDETVYANSGNILIKDYSTNIIYRSINVTSARVTGAGTNTITIDPHRAVSGDGTAKTFSANKRYYVEIPTGAFKDASNNNFAGISSKTGFNFTVGETTNTKPLLSSLSPINGDETIVAGTPEFKMTFDRVVTVAGTNAAKAVPKNVTSTNQPIDLIATVDSRDRKIVKLVPQTELLANTEYYISIPHDLIADTNGNKFDGIENTYQWTFKTLGGDRTPPKVMRAEAYNNKIRLVYDELLNERKVPPIASFYITIDGVAKSISSLEVEKNAVVFTMYDNVKAGQHVFISYTKSATTPLQDLTGNEGDSFVNQSATIGQITSVPTVTSSSYSGRSITLEFNEPIQKINTLAYLQFAVSVNNENNPVTSITQNGTKITLGLTNSISSNRTVVVNYAKNSYPLKGFNNDVASFTLTVGVGGSQNTVAPDVSSITASNSEIRILYNQPVTMAPYANQYTVYVDGVVRAITNVKLENQAVVLTLSSSVEVGNAVTVSYTAAPAILLSASGNNQFAPSYQNKVAVVGTTTTTGKVTLQSVIAKGNTITLNYNKALDQSYLPALSQFFILIDGSNWTVRSAKIEGQQLILTLPSSIKVGAEGTLSYYTTTDTLRATDGERVDMISNVKITNQSTVIDVLSDEYASISTGVLLKESTATKSNSVSPSGKAVTQYFVDNAKLTTAIDVLSEANFKDAEIRFEVPTSQQAAVVAFPMAALQNADKKGQFKFTVKYGDIYFEVPTASFDIAKAVNLNKGSAFSNSLVLKIESGSNHQTASLESAIRSNNSTLIGGPYLFEADVVGPIGSSELPLIGNLIRKVSINTSLNTYQTGAVFYDEAVANISGVPTTFTNQSGSTEVTFMRPGSSAYAVISSNKTYNDTAGHWANSSILTLSRKFIAEGHSATTFNPQQNITRGEFATYLVKGLGLSADKEAAKQFKDVNSASMLGGYIGAAAKAGIVSGVSANEFKPNAFITRQDMAIMMMRVVSYTKMEVSLTASPESYLSRFNDANKVSSYARTQVAQAIQVGVITGTSTTMISPLNNATRAEGVTMIERVLRKANYIQ